jgi:hypothetical protein
MEPHEDRLVPRDVPVHKCDDFGLIAETEDMDPQVAVPRRERSGCFCCARTTQDHALETKQEARHCSAWVQLMFASQRVCNGELTSAVHTMPRTMTRNSSSSKGFAR